MYLITVLTAIDAQSLRRARLRGAVILQWGNLPHDAGDLPRDRGVKFTAA
jgi:hypothetical protein